MDFVTAECRKYAKYWYGLPRKNFVPSKSSFFPENIPELLQNFIMHDFLSPEESYIRLVGTAIEGRYSENIKGRNYLDFVDEDRKLSAGLALQNMYEKPCGMRVLLRQKTKSGREYLSESLGFPLRPTNGSGCLLLFQNVIIDTEVMAFDTPDQLVNLGVSQRDYIDIGAGVPKTF